MAFKAKLAQLESQLKQAEYLRKEFDEFKQVFRTHAEKSKQIISNFLLESQKKHEKDTRRITQDKQFCEKVLKLDRDILEKTFHEQSKGFSTLAKAFSDYLGLRDEEIANYLEHKSPPAIRSAETVREMKSERKALEQKCRKLEYLVLYYEELFPFLAECLESDDMQKNPDSDTETDEDPARAWLSPEEYRNLPQIDKFQLALDNYWKRPKSSWQLGRDYERYVGYWWEQKGYKVCYHGIIKGFEDCGRDLICTKGEETILVQCKYWSQNKVIHEKHINQLFGTCVEFWINQNGSRPAQIELFPEIFKDRQIVPWFITSTTLSETAKKFSGALGIRVKENFPLKPYPCIKCNVSRKNGDRIYHLPFDQQYDSVLIEEGKNECFVQTVAEAEALGFRRAFRWHRDG